MVGLEHKFIESLLVIDVKNKYYNVSSTILVDYRLLNCVDHHTKKALNLKMQYMPIHLFAHQIFRVCYVIGILLNGGK